MDDKNWLKEQEDAKRDQDSNREIQKEGEEKHDRSTKNGTLDPWE